MSGVDILRFPCVYYVLTGTERKKTTGACEPITTKVLEESIITVHASFTFREIIIIELES